MSQRCHLSGLPIDVNSRVILLPVSYGAATESSFCYQSERNAMALHMPIHGTLKDYGQVTSDTVEMENFRSWLVSNLSDNDPTCAAGSESKGRRFSGSLRFAAMKRDGGMNGALRGEHCSPREILEMHDNPTTTEKRLPLTSLSVEEMINLLSAGSLTELSGGRIHHLSYILIDANFLEGLVNEHYIELWNTTRDALNRLFFETHADITDPEDETFFTWMFFKMENELFEILPLSGSDQPRGVIGPMSRDLIKACKEARDPEAIHTATLALENWVDTLANYGLINHIYARIGKTFFPQMNTSWPLDQHNFTTFLSQAQVRRSKKKASEFSPKNGYDKDVQERYRWS